ncbi:hypothetical protein DMH04_20150 [Kibdelosporangium aridum]|uniref:Uncharacterized protein n=2 Tax=Kibdelosporangium aridum TaxID=2030 RepID=A0A428Z9Q6_KIBAR|nr:hypothetical protein DMH04_20150 [Kibdelosporangium aridum]
MDQRMAARVDRMSQRLDKFTASITPPSPDLREWAESQWGTPMDVVRLGEVAPEYVVPGRRKDGTVKGKRLIRRFFWNILRGVYAAVMNIFLLAAGGGMGNVLQRKGTVRGSANAQALELVDAARPAKDAWLAYSDTHAAIIDAGETPKVLWHKEKPHAPQVSPARRRITWPDGSVFEYA